MSNLKSTTEILTCPVCRQLLNMPRVLPCYHSYCEKCLDNMQVQSKITCPECRNEATVPFGDVKLFPNNFFVNRLVDELINKRTKEGDEEVQCDNCDENDNVVAYCPGCSLFLCQICYSYHKRDRATRNHGVVVLSEIITNPNQTDIKTLQCREHGSNELQYYCETCNELICVYCTVKEHKDHTHNTVKKMAAKFRHSVNENIASVENRLSNLLKLHSDVEVMVTQLKNQDTIFKEIDEHYDTLIDKIKEQKYQVKQQVSLAVLEKVKALTLQLEEIDSMQMQFLYMKEQNDSVKKSSNPDEKLLSIQKEMTAYAKQWMETYNELDTQPVESDTIQFFSEEVPFPQFGQVLSKPDPSESELSNLPKYVFQNVPVEFSITAKYSNGCKYPKGGNRISIQVQPQSGDVENVVSTVKDNQDGTYTAMFTVKKVGKVKVSVFLDGEQIKDSPYNIMVARNYPAVTKPSDVMDISGHGHINAKPWGIAFGKNDVWAVADWTNHCVYVFYKEGQLLWRFGSKGCSNGQLDNPCGIAFDNNNHLYVADYNNHRVQKFDINGNYILQFTGNESSDGCCLSTPVDITVHEGMVYVTDATANCIVKFYTNGQFCQVIGKGYLKNPNGITVDCNDHLLVTNLGDDSVYIFTLNGQYLGKFGTSGSGRGQLSGPRSITSDSNGFILIADTSNHRIAIFDKDGKCVHCLGCKGTGNSQFLHPRGIALDPNGSIYISDNLNKCIKLFEV